MIFADTDRDINQHVSALLKLHGLQVHRTHSTDETIEQLTTMRNNIDLVCINGELAAKNGGMLLSRIKDTNPNTRVFVIADVDAGYGSDLLRYGVDEYIEKPLGTDTIVAKSVELARGKRGYK